MLWLCSMMAPNTPGFQVQVGQRTIQGELEEALAKLGPNRIRVVGAGRTDAGVHSEGQTVSFRDDGLTVPVERLPHALNALLPPDIRVVKSWLAPPGFHARYSARQKTYRYQVYEGEFPSVFYRRYALWVREPVNWQAVAACAELFVGRCGFCRLCRQRRQRPNHSAHHGKRDGGSGTAPYAHPLHRGWIPVQDGAQPGWAPSWMWDWAGSVWKM